MNKVNSSRGNEFREKIKQLNIKTIIILIINITIVVVLCVLGAVQFEEIDDYMIYELLSGKWGEATSYTVYLNIFVSMTLEYLFKLMPSINWYVLMLLITHILSFTILGYLVNKKFKNGTIIYFVMLLIMYIPFLLFLQYTSQAALLILSGCLLAFDIIGNKEKKWKLIISFVLIVFGSLIRFGTILYVLPYVALIIAINIINKKINKSQVLVSVLFYLITMLSCLILNQIHTNIYNSSPIYKEYLEYNSVRTFLHDYMGNNYEENAQVYNSIGWSTNDYITLKLFNNADNLVFSKENMEYIRDNVNIVLPSLRYVTFSFFDFFCIPYIILLGIMIYKSIKQKNKYNILIAILAIAFQFIFIFMNKIHIRTCMLNYVIAIVFMIFTFDEIKIIQVGNVELYLQLIAIILVIYANVLYVESNKQLSIENSYNQLRGFVANNQDKAYIHVLSNKRHIKRNILSTKEQKLNNFCPLASWLIYSENYLAFKEKYDIDEMYAALVDNPDVYLVVSSEKYAKGYTELDIICNYIKEHYLIENINVEEIKNFNNQIIVYKLSR